jgi:multiple sugar transport system substrate-binding protein
MRSQSKFGRIIQRASAFPLLLLLPLICSCDRKSASPDIGREITSHINPTITWMVGAGPDRKLIEKLAEMFQAQHPEIHLDVMWVPPAQYQVKLKTLIAADQAPDIFWCSDAWVAYELPFLADLTPLVKRDATELDLDDIYPELLAACRYEGKQILLPRMFNVSLLYFNRTLFDQAHVAYPSPDWTWDDYIRAGERLTHRRADGRIDVWGTGIMTGWWGEWMIYVRQAGGQLFADDMQHCLIDSPQAVTGLQFYMDKIYKYHVAPRPGFGPESGFISGKLGMEMGGHTSNWTVFDQIPGFDWDIQILPKGPVTRRGGELAIDTYAVWKKTKHLEEAWKFIKFLVSKPSIRLHVENGYLSVRKSIANELLFTSARHANPRNVRAAYEQLQYAEILPRSPDLIEITLQVIQPDVDRALDKQLDAATVCRDAAQAANRFIEVLGTTRTEANATP